MNFDLSYSKSMPYVSKGWGYELWIDNNKLYCGKQLFIHKGKKLSVHYHKLKTETFFVHEGEAEIITYTSPLFDKTVAEKGWDWFSSLVEYETLPQYVDAKVYRLRAGDRLQIPIEMRHTVRANLNTLIYEFSTEHFDSDSYRVLKGD